MNAAELVRAIEANGGHIRVDGPDLVVKPKESATPLREELVRHKEAILALVRERELDRLRVAFVAWFDSKIHLDARGIALRQTPTWSTLVDALHADFVRWTLERDLAPPTGEQFLCLLRELCCSIRVIGTEQFVDYVALKEDIQAHEQFARSE